MLNRRHLLQILSSGALAACSTSRLTTTPREPWRLGWQTIQESERFTRDIKREGKIPDALLGNFYRNGPGRVERNGQMVSHWFLGDGMVQRWHLEKNGISHRARFVDTYKYVGESRLNKVALNTTELPTRSNDDFNTANTSVLPLNGSLLALWEGGSAYELDPETLQTRGVKTWRDDLQFAPFSAHPLPEKDGSYWNFGLIPYAAEGLLLMYRISANGELSQQATITTHFTGMAHAFVQTERYLIVPLFPVIWDEANGITWFDQASWQPQFGSRVLIIDKNTLSLVNTVALPAGLVFHYGSAIDTATGIELFACWYDDAEFMYLNLQQTITNNFDAVKSARMTRIDIPLHGGSAKLHHSVTNAEFPVFDIRNLNHTHAVQFCISDMPNAVWKNNNGIARVDWRNGKIDRYHFGDYVFCEEHLFVADPKRQRAGAGWLLGTTLDCRRGITSLNIFDSEHLSDGPIARAHLPYAMPLGFHGAFKAVNS